MQCLKLPGGRETTDLSDIRTLPLLFYEDLFRAEDCDKSAEEHRLSYSELTQAVQQQNSGRTPGLDGLSEEFYKVLVSFRTIPA